MSTATRAPKSAHKSAPAHAPAPSLRDDAPTLQETLNDSAPAPAPRVETIVAGDANTAAFMDVTARLDRAIRSQSKGFLGYYIDRGDIVREGINVKLAKARNRAQRAEYRAAALRAMELVALGAYDSESEPLPKLDKWVSLSALAETFPDARKLGGVKLAELFATTLTRVDPPASWDAPETYALKRTYDRDAVAALIARAVAENMTLETARAELDALGGLVNPEAPAESKGTDPVAAARKLAETIVSRINDRSINPETLFDALQSELHKYGWTLVKGHGGNGAETLRPVKTGKASK